MGFVEPTERRMQVFMETTEPGVPVVMINLLRYREQAEYPEGSDAAPCTGREAYGRYGAGVGPLIGKAGGRPIWMAGVSSSLIAADGEDWNDAILVEYPSRDAFLEMVSSSEYQAIAVHRTAALEDSRLIATKTGLNLLES